MLLALFTSQQAFKSKTETQRLLFGHAGCLVGNFRPGVAPNLNLSAVAAA